MVLFRFEIQNGVAHNRAEVAMNARHLSRADGIVDNSLALQRSLFNLFSFSSSPHLTFLDFRPFSWYTFGSFSRVSAEFVSGITAKSSDFD
jgi:hypothetical protein